MRFLVPQNEKRSAVLSCCRGRHRTPCSGNVKNEMCTTKHAKKNTRHAGNELLSLVLK